MRDPSELRKRCEGRPSRHGWRVRGHFISARLISRGQGFVIAFQLTPSREDRAASFHFSSPHIARTGLRAKDGEHQVLSAALETAEPLIRVTQYNLIVSLL